MICPFCKEEIKDGAIKCKHCGSMLNGYHSDEGKDKIYLEEKARHEARKKLNSATPNYLAGNLIGVLGSILMIAGLFLPWATLGFISVSGWTIFQNTKTLLVLGIGAALFSIIGLASKKIYTFVFVLCGLGSLGLLKNIYDSLQEYLSGKEVFGVSTQIGGGFWLSLVGAVVIFLVVVPMVNKNGGKPIPNQSQDNPEDASILGDLKNMLRGKF